MDLAPDHTAARLAAQRFAAIDASHALLEDGEGEIGISIYGTTRPEPGLPPGGDPLAMLGIAAAAGLDGELYQITLPTPAETMATLGGTAIWARIVNRSAAWWADLDVSDEEGSAPLKLSDTLLRSSGLVRLTSAVFQG